MITITFDCTVYVLYDSSNINKGEDRWEGVSNRTVGSHGSRVETND